MDAMIVSMTSPATLDDDAAEQLARRDALAAGYREAARRALAFARRYREEEGAPGGPRERACILQANAWRRAARDMRALPRPGLARARESAAPPSTKQRAG